MVFGQKLEFFSFSFFFLDQTGPKKSFVVL